MSLSSKTWVVAIVAIAVIAVVVGVFCLSSGKSCPGCGAKLVNNICPNICIQCKSSHLKEDGGCPNCGKKDNPVCSVCGVAKDAENNCNCQSRPSVSPTVVDRVHDRTMKAWVQMTGRGSDADWGFQSEANFKYNVMVVSQSRIVEKTKLKSGGIRVVEIRKFTNVTDSLAVSDFDFKLNLSTLPLEAFDKASNLAIGVCGAIFGFPAGPIILGKDQLAKLVKKIDGVSIKDTLNSIGLWKPDFDEIACQLCGEGPLKGFIKGKFKQIEGKSYKIIYLQDADNMPLIFHYTYEDGTPVTNDEENLILDRVNALIDHHSVPNINCKVGDTWRISAENIQECFDPFVDGTYTGEISVNRMSNDAHKNWVLKLDPAQINVIGKHGSVTGSLRLKDGKAIVNPNAYSVTDVSVEGEATLRKLSRHHILFTTHLAGACQFEGRLISVIED